MRPIANLFLIAMLPLSGCTQEPVKHSSEALKLELSVNQAGLDQGKVILKSTLINRLDAVVSYLPWGTPLDSDVNGRFLVVTNSMTGKELPYHGKMVKRRAAIASDYIALNPLDSVTRELDLSISYNFCANSRYILRFSGQLTNSSYATLPIEVESIEFDTGGAFQNCL